MRLLCRPSQELTIIVANGETIESVWKQLFNVFIPNPVRRYSANKLGAARCGAKRVRRGPGITPFIYLEHFKNQPVEDPERIARVFSTGSIHLPRSSRALVNIEVVPYVRERSVDANGDDRIINVCDYSGSHLNATNSQE